MSCPSSLRSEREAPGLGLNDPNSWLFPSFRNKMLGSLTCTAKRACKEDSVPQHWSDDGDYICVFRCTNVLLQVLIMNGHLKAATRRSFSTLKRLPFRAYSWCRRHPVASTSGCCATFVFGLLIGLLFAIYRSETVRIKEIIDGAAANQSGVRCSFLVAIILESLPHTSWFWSCPSWHLGDVSCTHLQNRSTQQDCCHLMVSYGMWCWIYDAWWLVLAYLCLLRLKILWTTGYTYWYFHWWVCHFFPATTFSWPSQSLL
jgi:hypothetical protein